MVLQYHRYFAGHGGLWFEMSKCFRAIACMSLAVTFVMATFVAAAEAKDGHIDRSFGGDGQIEIGMRLVGLAPMTVGQDNSIVVLNNLDGHVVRYQPDG